MGIDFRGKGYVRRVSIGKRTVKDGEAVALWDQYGRHRQVVGPALIRLWYSTIRFLDKRVAGKDEYLKVLHADGTVEHLRGPATLFENPVFHQSVSVQKAIPLRDLSQFVVVQREEEVAQGRQLGGQVTSPGDVLTAAPPTGFQASQLIIPGPAVFFPEATDKVHHFPWAADEQDERDRRQERVTWKDIGIVRESGKVLDTSYKLTRPVTCDLNGLDGYGATAQTLVQFQLTSVKEVLAVANPLTECDRVVRAVLADEAAKLKFHDSTNAFAPALRRVVSSGSFVERLRSTLASTVACQLLSISLVEVKPGHDLDKVLCREDELAAHRVAEQKADAALEAAHARAEREHALEATKQKHELQLEADRAAAAAKRADAEAKQALVFLKELKGVGADVTKYLEAQATRDKMPPGLAVGAQGAKAAGGSFW
jgi:regulator of protease activity HflC (stomatin/prohibitin superfamily)